MHEKESSYYTSSFLTSILNPEFHSDISSKFRLVDPLHYHCNLNESRCTISESILPIVNQNPCFSIVRCVPSVYSSCGLSAPLDCAFLISCIGGRIRDLIEGPRAQMLRTIGKASSLLCRCGRCADGAYRRRSFAVGHLYENDFSAATPQCQSTIFGIPIFPWDWSYPHAPRTASH